MCRNVIKEKKKKEKKKGVALHFLDFSVSLLEAIILNLHNRNNFY